MKLPPLTRRSFMQSAAVTAGASLAPWPRTARAAGETPHFFLLVTVSGGLDASYLWDARPLLMTDKGKIQNYLYKNAMSGAELLPDASPLVLAGANGTSTLRTALTEPLMKHQSQFSVLNGVCMLTNGFVGHGNNMYYLFSNSPNPGRDSFVPLIGAQGKKPLDSVHIGGFEGDGNQAPANFAGSIQLFPGQGGNLANALKTGPQLEMQSPLMQHVMARLNQNAQGTGKFSTGSKKMESGLGKAPALAETLKNVAMGGGTGNELLGALDTALAYFKGGVTSAITLMYDMDPVMDVHDSGSAQTQLTLFREVATSLGALFDKLDTTAYDEAAGLSFLDVTTVVVTSEFSRTMMQQGAAVDQTGTDHNPLTNSVLVAGKGIKGGQVFGASDLATVTEAGELEASSKAHKEKDPSLTSIMGRPFDFQTEKPRTDLPETFQEGDYLTFASVANTLMSLYGVPEQSHFRIGSVAAKTVKGLLK